VVKVDYAKKSISVTRSFKIPRDVPYKIKASFEEWRSWYKAGPDNITIDDILSHISRPVKGNRDDLKTYMEEMPRYYQVTFYKCFVYQAKFYNPLTAIKRRGSPHDLQTYQFKMIVVCAKWLYVIFKHWKSESKRLRPKELQDFLNRYNLILNSKCSVASVVVDALMCLFNIDLGDYECFYNNHIKSAEIKTISDILARMGYFPACDPLNILFQNLPVDQIRKILFTI